MRTIFMCVGLAAAVMAAGCINKGPYYIYGDYIEERVEEGAYGVEGECPPEGAAADEGRQKPQEAAPAAEAGGQKVL